MRSKRNLMLAALVGMLIPLSASAQNSDAIVPEIDPVIVQEAAPELSGPVLLDTGVPALEHVHGAGCGCNECGYGRHGHGRFGHGMGHGEYYNYLWGGYCGESRPRRTFRMHRRFRSDSCHGECQSGCEGCTSGCDSCSGGNWFSRSSLFNRSFGRRSSCDSCTSGLGCDDCGSSNWFGHQVCDGSLMDGCYQGMRRFSRGCNDRLRRFSSSCGRGIREFCNDCSHGFNDFADDCGRGFRRMRSDCGRFVDNCTSGFCSTPSFRPMRRFRGSGCSDCHTGDCGCTGSAYGHDSYMVPSEMPMIPGDSHLPAAPPMLNDGAVEPGLIPQPEDSVDSSIFSRITPAGFSAQSMQFPRLRKIFGE